MLGMALTMLFAFVVPLAGVAIANHGTRTLEVTPETDDNAVGTTHTLTATLSSAPDAGSPIEIDFEVTGPGDPDTGDTPATPDLTCTITTGTTCTVSFSSAVAGVSTIRGWIDHDKNNATLVGEADLAEGAVEGTTPGDQTEPDTTDVVTKTWFAALPGGAALDCDDESGNDTETNQVTGPAASETYTCTLVDTGPNPDTPIAGALIDAENLGGANDPDDSAAAGTADMNNACTTGANGTCQITIAPIDSQAGPADICFWVDEDNDNAFDPAGVEQDSGECGEAVGATENDDTTDVVNKTWATPAVTSIDVTPDSDVNQTGSSHTATATVTDQFGNPVAGVNVDWRVTGRNTVSQNDTITNANGQVTITYTDTGAVGSAGNDAITACTDQVVEDDDCGGAQDTGEVSDTADKRWIPETIAASDVEIDMEGCNGDLGDFTDTTGGDA